jgi:hypothetical protein
VHFSELNTYAPAIPVATNSKNTNIVTLTIRMILKIKIKIFTVRLIDFDFIPINKAIIKPISRIEYKQIGIHKLVLGNNLPIGKIISATINKENVKTIEKKPFCFLWCSITIPPVY